MGCKELNREIPRKSGNNSISPYELLIERIYIPKKLIEEGPEKEKEVVEIIKEKYQKDESFRKILEILQSALYSIKKIVISAPTSIAGAYISKHGGIGCLIKDDGAMIIAYFENNPEYTLALTIHELAHQWIRLRSKTSIPPIYDESLAYLITFKAGFRKIYEKRIRGLISVFSNYEPPEKAFEEMGKVLLEAIIPQIIAAELDREIGIEKIDSFLKTVIRKPEKMFDVLKNIGKHRLKPIGNLLRPLSDEHIEALGINKKILEQVIKTGERGKHIPPKEFYKILKSEGILYSEEVDYMYQGIRTIMSLIKTLVEHRPEEIREKIIELLNDTKKYSKTIYSYLDHVIKSPDDAFTQLLEAEKEGIIPPGMIDEAIEEEGLSMF